MSGHGRLLNVLLNTLLDCLVVTVQRGQGDPRGRRIARRRNLQLAEAARAGRVFSALLGRADYPAPELSDLLAAVADEEAGQLMRSAGHIEPRKRFKSGSGQPLHEVRVPDYLFLDEYSVLSTGEVIVLRAISGRTLPP